MSENPKNENTQQKNASNSNGPMILMGIALVGILGIGGFGMYKMTDSVASIQSEVSSLRSEVNQVAANQPSPKEFQKSVAETLEALASKKQQEMVDAKYAKYDAAVDPVPEDKSIYGNVNARFTLVEFSDLECPYCKKFHDTAKAIVDSSGGNINWQWKHLPLGFHNPAAREEALAAECVREQQGNRGFWVFLDDVFANSRGNGQGVPDLDGLIAGVGADVQKAQQCMDEGRYDDKIDADLQMAVSHGINGTPATFVVDNKTGRSHMLSGAQPAPAIMAVIKRLIAEEKESQEESEQS